MFRKTLLLLVLFSVFATSTDAFIFRMIRARRSGNARLCIFRGRRTPQSYTPRPNSSTYTPAVTGTSDQAKAQRKANIMASRGVLSHGVAPLCASFEGIGMGSSRNCNTCVPRRSMRLTADAAAYGHGRWYRVRGWR